MSANQLARETSPYLLQHADNPVHWRPWSRAALDDAAARDCPVLVSIGYAACHWCHVMAHESFEDEEVAEVMNRLFVNVKVDREERPDLDALYQTALAHMGEQGGWPLTMFLTPEGEPFWGGTYFPKTPRYGRPGFIQVMNEIARIWREERPKVDVNRLALGKAVTETLAKPSPGTIDPVLIERLAGALAPRFDPHHGGLAGAPKFPQTPVLELLFRGHERNGDRIPLDAAARTLQRMCLGGIYDHLGGGFARYSVDERWLIPHFEKMLYDNALLVPLMLALWRRGPAAALKWRIEETVDWMIRDLGLPGGGFASSFDADSEGVEGRYYVWSADEVDAALGPDAARFRDAYDVSPGGNWEGATILNRLHLEHWPDDDAALAPLRARLLAIRSARVPPLKDDKALADWNGLAIAAIAEAAASFGRADWLAAARAGFDFVATVMADDRFPERLRHAWRAGIVGGPGILDDYGAMVLAALALHGASGDAAYIAKAEVWVRAADRWHRDEGSGAYFQTASDVGDIPIRPLAAIDHATPSGAALLAQGAARLFRLTANAEHRARAEAILDAHGGDALKQPFGHVGLLNALDDLSRPVDVVLAGPTDDAFTRAAYAAPAMSRAVLHAGTDEAPIGHPAHGKLDAGRFFLCRDFACLPPAATPEDAVALFEA